MPYYTRVSGPLAVLHGSRGDWLLLRDSGLELGRWAQEPSGEVGEPEGGGPVKVQGVRTRRFCAW